MPLPRVLEPEVMSIEEEAGEYDAMDFSATDQLFAERAAEMGANAAWVVDIGSGNAKIPLAMSKLLPDGTRVVATDMSAEMLAVGARNRTHDGIRPNRLTLTRTDAKHLPFANSSIDLVTSNSLVHHIPDPRDVFREIARIAGADGRILIRDLVRPESESELNALLQKHAAGWSPVQRRLFEDSLHAALTVDEVRRALEESGIHGARVAQITDRHWSAER